MSLVLIAHVESQILYPIATLSIKRQRQVVPILKRETYKMTSTPPFFGQLLTNSLLANCQHKLLLTLTTRRRDIILQMKRLLL